MAVKGAPISQYDAMLLDTSLAPAASPRNMRLADLGAATSGRQLLTSTSLAWALGAPPNIAAKKSKLRQSLPQVPTSVQISRATPSPDFKPIMGGTQDRGPKGVSQSRPLIGRQVQEEVKMPMLRGEDL